MVCVDGAPNACLARADAWLPAPIRTVDENVDGASGDSGDSGGKSDGTSAGRLRTRVQRLLVDLSVLSPGQPVYAIRYGWPLDPAGDSCCPTVAVKQGNAPCVPGSCPLLTATHALPPNPFLAFVSKDGQCKCMPPQDCSGH